MPTYTLYNILTQIQTYIIHKDLPIPIQYTHTFTNTVSTYKYTSIHCTHTTTKNMTKLC